MKRTEKEMLFRRVGKWLGIGYRFHRLRGLQVGASGTHRCCLTSSSGCRPTKTPKYWGFEFWKKVPGNPRNCYNMFEYDSFAQDHKTERINLRDEDAMKKYELKRSDLKFMDVPKEFKKKDDVIDWLLFESDFLKRAGGASVKSMEELNLRLETAFVPEKI